MNKLGAVIRFTYGTQVKRKSFVITSVIFVILITLLTHLPGLIAYLNQDAGPKKIGFVGEAPDVLEALQHYYAEQSEPALEIVPAADEEAARRLLAEKEITGYLHAMEERNVNGIPAFQYKSKDTVPFIIGELMEGLQYANQLAVQQSIGLTDAQWEKLFAPVELEPVQVTEADEAKSESEIQLAFILVYVMLFLLYMGVLGYGASVATEITAEKSSRVMELLVSSVSPLTQMFGKIIGICLLGLTQMACTIGAGVVNLLVQRDHSLFQDLNINVAEINPMLIVYFFIFYLLGYFLYSTVFAACGSLVSRTEEVSQVISPVIFLIIAVFFVAMYGLSNPNAPFIVVMSFVPFFSPMLMFLRIGMSDPAAWEIWLSIALLVAGSYVLGWIAAKIYRTGVLMYGKLPTWKELRTAMKAYDV